MNEISRDLNIRWISDGYALLIRPQITWPWGVIGNCMTCLLFKFESCRSVGRNDLWTPILERSPLGPVTKNPARASIWLFLHIRELFKVISISSVLYFHTLWWDFSWSRNSIALLLIACVVCKLLNKISINIFAYLFCMLHLPIARTHSQYIKYIHHTVHLQGTPWCCPLEAPRPFIIAQPIPGQTKTRQKIF